MRSFLIVLLALIACLGGAWASKCTEECDRYVGPYQFLYAGSGNVTFCGTDYKTHNTFSSALNNFTYTGCYASRCNIGILFPGTCGCPNNCSANIGRGKCGSGDVCSCAKGWGGNDCSNVVCNANNCSGHGKCVAQKDKDGGDMCQCQNGWTSADCSVAVPSILANRLPYGQLFPGKYYEDDKYGDFHPVLNASLVSSIRVTVKKDDLFYMFTPTNQYNQSDTKCDVYIFNGYTSEYIKDVTIALHGALGRVYNKKSFNLHFGDTYKKLTGLNLLSNKFDRMVSFEMMGEFHRAMMSQTYRMSMTELWVNEVYYGMYTMVEKINNHFEESRFDVSDNDMFKFGIYDFQYLGYNPVPYQNIQNFLYETPRNCITKKEGDDSWVNFVDFVQAMNSSKLVRDDYLRTHFDISLFLRAIAIETVTMDYDGYSGTGNNYYLTDAANKNTAKPFWKWTAFDFEAPLDGLNVYQSVLAYTLYNTSAEVLNYLIENRIFIPPNNVSDNFLSLNPYKFIHRPEAPKPLLLAVFDLPEANSTYTNNMRTMLNAIYGRDNGATLAARYQAYYSLARTGLSRDQFYAIDGTTMALFDTAAYSTVNFMNTRFASLLSLVGGIKAKL